MQKNEKIKLEIEDMGADGAGIGKSGGMTFFVKDAIIGDVITARITKLKKNYGYARIEEIEKPSPYRTEPVCALNRRCGGCQIQAMDYAHQLFFKQKKIKDNLVRIGGFDADFVAAVTEPIVGMEEPFRYRNKAQFPIGTDKDGKPVAGFYAARTHSIIPVEDCLLGVKENQAVLEEVLAYMRENHVPAYNEQTGEGLVRHVLIRYGFATGEIMACVVLNGTELPAQQKLIEKLCKLKNIKSISLNFNNKRTNVILGEKTVCIWGQSYITDYIHLWECSYREKEVSFLPTDTAISYQISPQSFYQVNPVQTEKLYSLALDYAQLTGKETVWDLYCGIGTISLFLAQKAGKVCGVEIVPQAIADAKDNARRNHITNAEFFVGKAEEVLPEFYEKESRKAGEKAELLYPDVIVVDPPRKGCEERCLETMVKMQPERIVYVSCDSATLARDLKYLCQNGYELKRVRGVDQFGQTVHVETVVLLSKLRPDDYLEVDLDLDELDVTAADATRGSGGF